MRSYQPALAVVLLAVSLFAGGNVSHAADPLPVPPDALNFIQPFFLVFDRNEDQVIVFLANHPVYEAIEVMVTRRAGQQPLLRAIITRHDTDQIDHINDAQLARERAALLAERKTVYRPILYEQSEVGGIVTSRLRFKSYRGEDIDLHFQALAPVSTALGGLIATEHAREEALPVLWSNASALASPETRLTIDGVSYPLRPGPQPGSLFGFYSAGFLLGIVYEASLELYQLQSPRRLAEGEKWVYLDNHGNQHVYEIIDVAGELLTIRKTTTSSALTEEIITVRREGNGLQLRSVRATGRGRGGSPPSSPSRPGFVLELSEGGEFSLSLDEHVRLITGSVSIERGTNSAAWILRPEQPEWATLFVVRATVTRVGNRLVQESMVGEPASGTGAAARHQQP